MKFDDINLTDLNLGQGDYWFPALPIATDKEKPFIRPCKVGTTRYLAFFDVSTETWHSVQMTNL